MAYTESTMLPLGTQAPDFALSDTVSGRKVSLEDMTTEQGLLLMFICNHCPYVIHVLPEINRLTKEYLKKGVGVVAISSNDVDNYPEDAPDKMKELALENHFGFPYLYDETQEVARAYDAACTPDFYVFNGDQELVYRGRLDGSRPNNDVPLTGEDLRAALDAMLEGKPVPEMQYPSGGCGIKWKNS